MLDGQSFSTLLLLGLVALVLLTTLSAGVPAYLIARGQLRRQAQQHMNDVQQSTMSLYLAQYRRLSDQVMLLAERPAFRRLAAEPSSGELADYLETFRGQSGLDALTYCRPEGPVGVGDPDWARCPVDVGTGYQLLNGRPALVIRRQVLLEGAAEARSLFAVAWLGELFLRQMAANTGAEQGLLTIGGVRLASSRPTLLPPRSTVTRPRVTAAGSPASEVYTLAGDGSHFLTTVLPLVGDDDQAPLLVEIALSIDALRVAETQAAAILVASTTAVALLGLLLGALYIRRLTTPLQRLTQSAERIGQGDFALPPPDLGGPSEVATLAAAFRQSQTAMIAALDERSQARDWLDRLIQSIVEGVITLDAAGRITFMSQGAERLAQRTADQALGRPVDDLFHLPEGGDGTFSAHIPMSGERRQIEVVTTQGKELVLAVTGVRLAPAASPGGDDAAQAAVVLRDVTAEETLRTLRSYFLANISHEFRTPLSTLSASMELLLDENENLTAEEMRKLLRPSHLSLIGLQTLVDNLLESSSIEAGRFALRRRSISLNQVITQALHIVNPLLLRRSQALSLVEPAYLPELWADSARLTQVLVNLLSNASKYSPIGEAIDLTVEVIGGSVRVAVADRGPGVAETDRTQLFQRFVRLDGQTGEQYGVGLGLHVVKTIVEAHGGRLGIDGRAGGGSIFWFELAVGAPAINESSETAP